MQPILLHGSANQKTFGFRVYRQNPSATTFCRHWRRFTWSHCMPTANLQKFHASPQLLQIWWLYNSHDNDLHLWCIVCFRSGDFTIVMITIYMHDILSADAPAPQQPDTCWQKSTLQGLCGLWVCTSMKEQFQMQICRCTTGRVPLTVSLFTPVTHPEPMHFFLNEIALWFQDAGQETLSSKRVCKVLSAKLISIFSLSSSQSTVFTERTCTPTQ